MPHKLEDTVSLLSRTPSVLAALLRDLPEAWTLANEGGNTWTVFEVVTHFIHCERSDWMPRVKMVLRCGETQTFEPLDRTGGREQSQGKSLNELLDEFASLRSASLDQLLALKLTPEDLALRGRHPALGAVTLSELLSTWPVHDLTHIHQISRIMAHQYRNAVGPWAEYLGVLRCTGHGPA